MCERCRVPIEDNRHHYFDRGITVCDRWKCDFGFDNFLADMGPCPDGHTIDRIDNDQGYYKENCRWADPHTQQRNRGNNKWVTISGIYACVADHADRIGITQATLYQRMKAGWTDDRICKPARAYPKGVKKPRHTIHSPPAPLAI